MQLSLALNNSQSSSGWFFSNSELDLTGTNDSSRSTERSQLKVLVDLLRECRGKNKKISIKGYWDKNSKPFFYADQNCEENKQSIEQDSFEEYKNTLSAFATLQDNWDSYGAEAPNSKALDVAEKILKFFKVADFPPTKIVPSVEGGISFLFIRIS